MSAISKVALGILILGGLNWGLVGAFDFNFVGWLLGGSYSLWSRIVYGLVGISALWCLCLPASFGSGRQE